MVVWVAGGEKLVVVDEVVEVDIEHEVMVVVLNCVRVLSDVIGEHIVEDGLLGLVGEHVEA